MNGKGSKRRPEDLKVFLKNYEEIDWKKGSEPKTPETSEFMIDVFAINAWVKETELELKRIECGGKN